MGRLVARERTALFLYVVLVLMPAVVLGGLFAHRLWSEHEEELAAVPNTGRDAAERLAEVVAYRLESLLEAEEERPFFHYQSRYLAPGTETSGSVSLIRTPLRAEPRPPGVLGWFAFNPYTAGERVESYLGADPAFTEEQLRGIAVAEARRNFYEETPQDVLRQQAFAQQVAESTSPRSYLLPVLGVNLHPDVDRESGITPECEQVWSTPSMLELDGHVHVSRPTLLIQRVEPGAFGPGALRLLVLRYVEIPGMVSSKLPECARHLDQRFLEQQYTVIDPFWLFEQLPVEASHQTLDAASQQLVSAAEALDSNPDDFDVQFHDVFDVLGFEVERDDAEMGLGVGLVHVRIDKRALRDNFRVQLGWLAGLALVLTISTTMGLRLLLGRIRVSREEAQRTRNFVASVSHELRTPIAAVKLYGEMLQEGWIKDEARQQEYLQRIVVETDRLSALVDRVLLRRRLQDAPPAPAPGDLNAEVLGQRHELELTGGKVIGDLTFELAENLPRVLLVPDGVHVVLNNLVENARKYAPVDVGATGAEPILVRTRRDRAGAVCLEVLDRGPGIAPSERRKIFDAFYRSGDEATRETTGTGLGLHLVALQARAMRARVEALPRDGGGTRFKVTFRAARGRR